MGDSTITRSLECNSRTIAATTNLYDALSHLRLPSASRLIWADAICINQSDLEERSMQVQLMREIYSRASRVVVWLGPDGGEGTATAISALSAIHKSCVAHAESVDGDLAKLCNDPNGLIAVRVSDIGVLKSRGLRCRSYTHGHGGCMSRLNCLLLI